MLSGFGVDSPIKIVPNGVDLNSFRPLDKGFRREELGINDKDLVLIYVGRLSPEKSLTMLLRAFAGAQAAVENLKLIIVGEGTEYDNLKDWCERVNISHAVRFTGKTAYNAVSDYLNIADAFVTPSVSEVHPLSIIEGMAVGLPAIGIESPGVGDIIQHNVNGILCRNDLADFTARMVRLMLDDTLRIRLATGATQTAKHYDIRRTSSQLHDHYQEIIDSTMQDSITSSIN